MKIWAIGVNTFREAVRNKIVYALLGAALAFIVSALFFGRLSLDQNARLIEDFGLFFLSLFGVVIAVFVGVTLLYDEIQRRTIHVLLSKPLRRSEFVLGKYLGMLMTLAVQVTLMALAIALLLWIDGTGIHLIHLQAVLLAYVELVVITAVALFFSSFSTPYLSGMFTVGVFVLGRLEGDVASLLPQLEPAGLRWAVWGVTRVLPELHRFDLTERVVYGETVGAGPMLWGVAYGLSYAAVVLVLAVVLFSRRDFS